MVLIWDREQIESLLAQHYSGAFADMCSTCGYGRVPCTINLLCTDWLTLYERQEVG